MPGPETNDDDFFNEVFAEVAPVDEKKEGTDGSAAAPAKEPETEVKKEQDPPAQAETKTSTVTQTPKEVLGEEYENWDQVKAGLSERNQLRQQVDDFRKQPQVAFANESVAGFNEFVKKTGVGNYGVYERITQVTQEDPMKVLVAKFILDNPEQSGNESAIIKRFERKFNVNSENTDDVEIGKIDMAAESKKAFEDIKAFREGLAVPAVQTPVDYDAASKQIESDLTQQFSTLDKIRVPMINPETKQVEPYMDIELPGEFRAQFAKEVSGFYARTANIKDPAFVQNAKNELVRDFVFKNFASIARSIKNKAETDKEAELDAKYGNAGKLTEKEPAPGAQKTDDVDLGWTQDLGK